MPTSAWHWALAATSIIPLLASCGGSETPATAAPGLEVPSSPTPAADPVATPDTTSPQDILDASLAAMEAVTSYRFTIDADVDATVVGTATQIPITFSGVYQAPDRIQATLLIRVGQSAVGVEVKTIAGATYVGDSRTGQWQESQQLRSVLPDPARLPADLTQDLGAVEVTKDFVGAAPVHRLQGLTPLGMFGELRPNGPVSIWIAAEDFLVRRIEAEGQIRLQELAFLLDNYGISNASGATVSMRLSAFGEPVAIDLPGRAVEPAPTGPGQRFHDQGNDHVRRGDLHPTYNSTPATSGWHYGQPLAPAPWGVHGVVLPDEVLVHNLEHGGIGVHYDCPVGCSELVAQLASIVEGAVAQGLKVIMTPYPGMETRIALTAWNFLDTFGGFDEERIRTFIRAHESSPNAPEPSVS